MAFSSDADLMDIVPDILSFGIDSFSTDHAKAQADIERKIRADWWDKRGFSGELKPQYLTDSQWTRANAYLVLWKYALPQLTNWVDGDRFQGMIDFYKSRFAEEIEAVFKDGVEYDDDNNGTIDNDEKTPINDGRLVR
jgi:hypothetical protein|tara:strand:+ start:306 stop:719 length:414 start_codon:yes stop_codon:yes gene_type:complete